MECDKYIITHDLEMNIYYGLEMSTQEIFIDFVYIDCELIAHENMDINLIAEIS